MTAQQISSALTSALLGPTLGACLVLVAWVVSLVRDGIPVSAQLRHAGSCLRPVVVPACLAAGVALVAGEPWQLAVSAGVSAGLVAAGFRAPA